MTPSSQSGARFGDVQSLWVEVTGDEFTSRVRMHGEVDLSTADLMAAALQFALRPSTLRLILDLSEVAFFSVSGLRVLMRLGQAATEEAVDFVLAAPSLQVMRVLELADAAFNFRIEPARVSAGGD